MAQRDHIVRNVDGGRFECDREHIELTDAAGHRAEFPASAVDELKKAVDEAAARHSGSKWFRAEEVEALDASVPRKKRRRD